MSQAISDFSGKFEGGARPNRFQVNVSFPTQSLQDFMFLCRSASQPASTLGEVAVPYMGRTYKIPGDRTFEDWTITIYNDNDHAIRKEFETWHQLLNEYEKNVNGSVGSSNMMGQANVWQLSQDGSDLHSYEFTDVWPKEIGAIDLAWDNNDAVEEFTVTMCISHHIKPDGV
jgi:hypothetical protein